MSDNRPLIVWVDDTAEHLFSQVWGIENAGYRVMPVAEPERALEIIREKQPVLALLDVVMPAPGGYELCRQLQAEHATADIPVILLSLMDGRKSMADAYSAGAVDYLLKPLDAAVAVPVVDIRLRTHALWLEVNRGRYGPQADAQVPAFVSYLHNRLVQRGSCPLAQNYRRDNLYEILSADGISQDRAARQVADFFKLPYLARIESGSLRSREFTPEFSIKNMVVALALKDARAYAVSNPLNKELLRRLRREVGAGELKLFVSPPSAIAAALGK